MDLPERGVCRQKAVVGQLPGSMQVYGLDAQVLGNSKGLQMLTDLLYERIFQSQLGAEKGKIQYDVCYNKEFHANQKNAEIFMS